MRNLQARVVLMRSWRVAGACAGKHGKHLYVSNLNYRKVSNLIVTLAIFWTRPPTRKLAPTPLNNAATHQNRAHYFPFLGIWQQTLAMPCMLHPVYP